MDRFDDDTLLAELREMRPTPRPEFTAELDERAAAGFPRRDSRASTNPFARLADWFRKTSPRRMLVPTVGLSIAVLAAAIVVVAVSSNGGSSSDLMTSATSSESGGGAVESETRGGAKGAHHRTENAEKTMHTNGEVELAEPEAAIGSACEAGTAGCGNNGKFNGNFFGESSGGKAKASKGAEVEAAPAEEAASEETEKSANAGAAVLPSATSLPPPSRGHRDIERSASIVLGTKPGEVAGAAAKVYSAVHAANGVVLNSSVESGRTGPTGASFSLLIPSRKLDDALAEFSKIAEVRSRHDATNDITAPTVGVTEELRDSNASIEGLLKELGNVETEAERESVEARLREERRRHAAIRASLEHLHKRASMSEVSLRIVTNHGAGVTPPGKGDGAWSVGDALHDAGNILTVAAGVLLIALAILAPIALIALLLWSLNRFRVRRLRERALG
jgi:hypothetical protein